MTAASGDDRVTGLCGINLGHRTVTETKKMECCNKENIIAKSTKFSLLYLVGPIYPIHTVKRPSGHHIQLGVAKALPIMDNIPE